MISVDRKQAKSLHAGKIILSVLYMFSGLGKEVYYLFLLVIDLS